MESIQAGRPFAVLDLGTAYVKALLVHRGPTRTWSVVGSATVSYPRQRGTPGRCSAAQLDAAEEAVQRAHRRAMRLAGRTEWPATCLVSVPDPPAHTVLYGQDYRRPQSSAMILGAEAHDLVSSAETAAASAALKDHDSREADVPPTWLGAFWEAFAVEGRPVTALAGFRGASVQLEVGVAWTGAAAADLRTWCHSQRMRPVLLPEPLWQAATLARSQGRLLLDIGARRTAVSYLGPTGNLHRLRMPVGGHHFTRYLSLAAHASPSRAERIKLAYSGGRLKDPTRSRIRRAMRRALGSWARRLGDMLASAAEVLPGRWLTCGGGSSLPELALLPALVADDSICQLDRYPVLQPLAPTDVCRHVTPGPERLGTSHLVSLAMADWWLSLSQERAAKRRVGRMAEAARQAGYEVDADWLKL